MEIRRFADLTEASRELADYLAAVAREEVGRRGECTLVLTGGSTPQALYRELASPAMAGRLPWSRMHLFWGDERMVPQDDPASNLGMARATLLDHIPLPATHIHAIVPDGASPERAAVAYEKELRRFFTPSRLSPQGFPRFDCVLLGMGEDGHVASLFPVSPLLAERQRWAAACGPGGSPPVPRVTLTLPVLNNAKRLVFLISGPRKAAILDEIVTAPNPALLPYPAALLQQPATLIWFVAP